jgi:hypothetical protein
VDDRVTPGTRYEYRLILIDGGGLRPAGEVTIDVPGRPLLAIERVEPNPSVGAMRVRFALPQDGPATLELLDLAGRLVRRVEVGANGAGSDVVDVSPGRPLAPGIYVVRLRQGGFSAAARVAVLR